MQRVFREATKTVELKARGALRVMTFNAGGLVKFEGAQSMLINEKITYIKSLLEEHKPDVLCVQESMIPDRLFKQGFYEALGFKGYTLYCKTVNQHLWSARQKWMSPHGQIVYVRNGIGAQYVEVGDFKNTVMVIPNENTDVEGQLLTTMTIGDQLSELAQVERNTLLSDYFAQQILVNGREKAMHEILNEEGRLMVFKFPEHNIVLVSAYVFFNSTNISKYQTFYEDENPVIEPRDLYDKNIQQFLAGVLNYARKENLNPNYDLVYAGSLNATTLYYKNPRAPIVVDVQDFIYTHPVPSCNPRLVGSLRALFESGDLNIEDVF